MIENIKLIEMVNHLTGEHMMTPPSVEQRVDIFRPDEVSVVAMELLDFFGDGVEGERGDPSQNAEQHRTTVQVAEEQVRRRYEDSIDRD